MEQLDLIFLPFFLLALLVLIFTVWAVRKFKLMNDENKSEIPGILDDSDISQRYNDIQYSEQPTFDVY